MDQQRRDCGLTRWQKVRNKDSKARYVVFIDIIEAWDVFMYWQNSMTYRTKGGPKVWKYGTVSHKSKEVMTFM